MKKNSNKNSNTREDLKYFVDDEAIRNRLKNLSEASKGRSKNQFSKESQYSRRSISRWTSDDAKFGGKSVQVLHEYHKFYKVSVSTLLYGHSETGPVPFALFRSLRESPILESMENSMFDVIPEKADTDTFDVTKISKRLKALRKESKCRQRDLAENFGCSRQCISNLEKGKNTLTVEMMVKYQNYFDVDAEYILYGEIRDVEKIERYLEEVHRYIEQKQKEIEEVRSVMEHIKKELEEVKIYPEI